MFFSSYQFLYPFLFPPPQALAQEAVKRGGAIWATTTWRSTPNTLPEKFHPSQFVCRWLGSVLFEGRWIPSRGNSERGRAVGVGREDPKKRRKRWREAQWWGNSIKIEKMWWINDKKNDQKTRWFWGLTMGLIKFKVRVKVKAKIKFYFCGCGSEWIRMMEMILTFFACLTPCHHSEATWASHVLDLGVFRRQ